MRCLFFVGILAVIGVTGGCRSTSKLEVVTGFEPDRYMGTWYEAARFPHGFEKNLQSVSAQYDRKKDGKIRVINQGFNTKTEEWESIEGAAKLKGNAELGWLKVSFFKPFYASYKIIHLDDDYTQAIVTGPTFGFLWILVRDPALPKSELDALIEKTQGFGFDTNKLIMVEHSERRP